MKVRVFAVLLVCALAAVPARASDGTERAGDVLQVAIPVLAYGMTFGYDDPEGRGQFHKSFATTLAVTWGLKLAVDNERPDGHRFSFPSGHTSAAFSGASFIQRRYGWRYGIPAYLAASFVGWTRVDSDSHRWEDVIGGAAIGVLGTYLFTAPRDRGIQLSPVVESGRYGFGIRGRW